jgi:hypothetical protein
MTEEDQNRRYSAKQCLKHPYLNQICKTPVKEAPKTKNKTYINKLIKKQPVFKTIKKIIKIFKTAMALNYLNQKSKKLKPKPRKNQSPPKRKKSLLTKK